MMRVFLDSSVLFSAAYSPRGHSRDLLLMAAREEIILVISKLVVEEVKRNLSDYAPDAVILFEQILDAIPFEYIHPTKKEILMAAEKVELKDAPIVAAAKKAKVDVLVTLDKKHLLGRPELVRYAGMDISTPQEAIALLKN